MTTRSATVFRKSDIYVKQKMRRLWRRIAVQMLLRLSADLLHVRGAECGIVTLVCPHRCKHLLFAVDQIGRIQCGDLKSVAVRDGVGGAGLDTISAEDAAVVIDVINLRIALGAGDALLGGVLGSLDINAIRRTGGGRQEAGHAFFQSVFVALQDMNPAEALLKLGALQRPRSIRIILYHGGLKNLAKGDAHTLGDS